jgi:hypothetical protein
VRLLLVVRSISFLPNPLFPSGNPTHPESDPTSPLLGGTASPLFDRLLPLYTSLTSLVVSSTDISPSALLSLPPSLRKLHIKSLSTVTLFTCSALLDVLRRHGDSFAFPDAFEELIVVDAPEQWGFESESSPVGVERGGAEEVKRLLKARGVKFTFKADFEEDSETTTSHSRSRTSGTGRPAGSAGTRTSTASSIGSRATEGEGEGDSREEERGEEEVLSSEQRSNGLVRSSSDGAY